MRERISHELGTAVNVQAMVFGNRDDNSGTGVGFTRNAATGENKPYGDFLVNAQGEDVVAGIRNTEDLEALGTKFPAIYKELLAIFDKLETHYRDMCDTEFTIEQGKLWMLQTRVGQAHRCCRAADGRRHDQGPAHQAVEERGGHAHHRRTPRPGAASAARVEEPEGHRHRPRSFAGRRGRPCVLHCRRRRRRGRAR